MDAGRTSSLRRRVVVLVRNGALADLGLEESELSQLECVCVAGAYEVAAEVLAAPTDAVVLDMSLLTSAQVGLLEVVRTMDIPILAFGTLRSGLGAEQLREVRLISRDDLRQALSELVSVERVEAPSAAEAEDLTPQELGEYHVESAPASPVEKKDTVTPKEAPSIPADLLTPEELSALLEDE